MIEKAAAKTKAQLFSDIARALPDPDDGPHYMRTQDAWKALDELQRRNAGQEAEAWEAITQWRKAGKVRLCQLAQGWTADGFWRFTVTDFHGIPFASWDRADRLEVLKLGAAWCRAELAK